MRRKTLLLALLLLAPLHALRCANEDEIEHWRRGTEGGLATPAEQAAVEAHIASLEADLGGVASGPLVERMAFHRTPGVQVAVVNRGVVEWTEAWGLANTVTGEPLSRSRRLQAGSISKPTAALAVLMLVEAGLLDLDAPVNAALSSWQIPDNAFTDAEPVTLRHLLSHTSGMNNSSFFGYSPLGPVPSLLDVLTGAPPATTPPFAVVQEPGTDWLYSGGGYTVLAQVLEDVTGADFADWTLANLFAPTGMWRSTFAQPLPEPEAYEVGVASLAGFPTGALVYPEQPAAGLWTTALDLGRLVVAIQRSLSGEPGAPLGASVAAGLVTPQSPGPDPAEVGLSPDPQMGLGFFLADGPEPGWFWHTGGTVGYTALVVGDLTGGGFGAAVLCNSFPGGRPLAWEIVNGIADLYGWPGWDDWGI